MIWMGILAVGILASEQAACGLLYYKPVVRAFRSLGLWELWEFLAGELVDEDGEPVYTHGPALTTLFLCTLYTTAWLAGDYIRMTLMVTIGTGLAARHWYGVWKLMRQYNKASAGDPSARAWLESKGIWLADED
jgi:hypothetical protein